MGLANEKQKSARKCKFHKRLERMVKQQPKGGDSSFKQKCSFQISRKFYSEV
jgi:hypothetical protein